MQSYINVFGSDCAAGWSVYSKLDQFMMLPQQSISMASATFVGQNLGACDIRRAKRGIRTAIITGMGCTAALMLPLMLAGRNLLGLFNQKPEVLYYGQLFVLWITPFYLFSCIYDILGGALRSAGEALATMLCMLGSFVVIRQIYLFIISRLTHSALLIALGYPLGWVLCCISVTLCYCLIPWEKKQRAIFIKRSN